MKKQKVYQILKVSFLVLIIAGITGLMAHLLMEKPDERIQEVQLGNNIYLSAREYLAQSGLQTRKNFEEKSPYELKALLESHPYIEQADVILTQKNILKVKLHEKNIIALMRDKETYGLLTAAGEVLPVRENLQYTDFPLISGISFTASSGRKMAVTDSVARLVSSVVLHPSVKTPGVKLSEVVFRKDKEVLLMFAGISGYIRTQMHLLPDALAAASSMQKNKDFTALLSNSNYIDMRFGKKVYITTHNREETNI